MRKIYNMLSHFSFGLGVSVLIIACASFSHAGGTWTCWSSCSCNEESFQGGHSKRCTCWANSWLGSSVCTSCNMSECPATPSQGNGCVKCG